MNSTYVVAVRGCVPLDLCEKVAQAHAEAVRAQAKAGITRPQASHGDAQGREVADAGGKLL